MLKIHTVLTFSIPRTLNVGWTLQKLKNIHIPFWCVRPVFRCCFFIIAVLAIFNWASNVLSNVRHLKFIAKNGCIILTVLYYSVKYTNNKCFNFSHFYRFVSIVDIQNSAHANPQLFHSLSNVFTRAEGFVLKHRERPIQWPN